MFTVRFVRDTDFHARLKGGANFKCTTPLHYAVLGDRAELVEMLLAAGADPSIRNDDGHLPIDYAKSPEIKRLLEDQTEKVLLLLATTIN